MGCSANQKVGTKRNLRKILRMTPNNRNRKLKNRLRNNEEQKLDFSVRNSIRGESRKTEIKFE